MQPETSTIEKIVTWGLLAGFGGAVKYVSAVIRAREAVSNQRFVMLLGANVFISSFCGLMGGMLVTTVTADRTWQYLACGIFGYLGTQGLDIVILSLKSRIEPGMPVSVVIPMPPAADPSNPHP